MSETLQLLRKVPVFEGLPEDQLEWFLSRSQELQMKPGETYAHQGAPADAMFVVLEGEVQGRGELAGDTVILPIPAGSVTGILPFSRMKNFTLGGRAVTDAHLLRFPASSRNLRSWRPVWSALCRTESARPRVSNSSVIAWRLWVSCRRAWRMS